MLVSSAGVAAVVNGVELAEVADEMGAVVLLEAIEVELPVAEAVALPEVEAVADAELLTPEDGAAVVFWPSTSEGKARTSCGGAVRVSWAVCSLVEW